MTLSDFATFSTAVSGIAVTVSIVYLALQTHQNTKHTRAMINQNRVALISELCLKATDPDNAAAIITARGGEPTPENIRKHQFSFWVLAAFYGWQDSFAQHERGLLDDDIYRQMREAVTTAMAVPSFRAEWQAIRVPGTKFAAFVDDIIANLPPSP